MHGFSRVVAGMARNAKKGLYNDTSPLRCHLELWMGLWSKLDTGRIVSQWMANTKEGQLKSHQSKLRRRRHEATGASLGDTHRTKCALLSRVDAHAAMRPEEGDSAVRPCMQAIRTMGSMTVGATPIRYARHATVQRGNLEELDHLFLTRGVIANNIPESLKNQRFVRLRKKDSVEVQREARRRARQAELRRANASLVEQLTKAYLTKSGCLYHTLEAILTLIDKNLHERAKNCMLRMIEYYQEWLYQKLLKEERQAELKRLRIRAKQVSMANVTMQRKRQMANELDAQMAAVESGLAGGVRGMEKRVERDENGWPIEATFGHHGANKGKTGHDVVAASEERAPSPEESYEQARRRNREEQARQREEAMQRRRDDEAQQASFASGLRPRLGSATVPQATSFSQGLRFPEIGARVI